MMKIKLSKNKLLIAIAMLFIFRMAGLYYAYPTLKIVYAISEISIGILAFFVALFEKCYYNKIFYLVTVFFFYNFLNTIIKGGDFFQILSSIISDYTIFLVVSIYIRRKEIEKLISASCIVFYLFLLINLIHMLFSDEGFGLSRSGNKIFVLAADNSLIMYIIIFVIVHEIRNVLKGNKFFHNILFYGICFFELYIGEAATSYFAFFVLLLGIVLAYRFPVGQYALEGIGSIAFLNYFLLYIRKIDFMQNIFLKMGKDLSMSGRDKIWDAAINLAQKSLWTGFGVAEDTYYVYFNGKFMEAHNMCLSLILQGGIVLLIIFIAIIWCSCINLKMKSEIVSGILFIGLMSYLVSFLVESPTSIPGFFYIISLCQIRGKTIDAKG